MQIYYSDSPMPTTLTKSLFLAGPSSRDKETFDWKIEAVKILEEMNFDGDVFIPVPKRKFAGGDESESWSYIEQVAWECECRHIADMIVFWVPRDIKGKMPGFTTNIEFGEDLSSGKYIYGRPDKADKCRYLDDRNASLKNITYTTLKELLEATVKKLGKGSVRHEGEIHIPLFIWQESEFQDWYKNIKLAGNKLIDAKVLNQVSLPNKKLFAYTLKVNIWVEAEKRNKSNEFVFFRKSISSILAYYKDEKDTHLVLVKEFRSPVNNSEGYVYELPGGSNFEGINALDNASHELYEETGIKIEDSSRFNLVNKRQITATVCTYTTHLYSIELNENEFKQAKENTLTSFGLQEDSEKTYVQVIALKDIFNYPVDYGNLGMIFEGLNL